MDFYDKHIEKNSIYGNRSLDWDYRKNYNTFLRKGEIMKDKLLKFIFIAMALPVAILMELFDKDLLEDDTI